MNECIFCGRDSEVLNGIQVENSIAPVTQFNCPNCGVYNLNYSYPANQNQYEQDKTKFHLVAGYLFETNTPDRAPVLVSKFTIKNLIDDPLIPRRAIQKIEKLLLYLYKNTEFKGGLEMNQKNKKTIIVLVCISILLLGALFIFLVTVVFPAQGQAWQTIELENVGSLRVPEDWVFTERNGVIYFTDGSFSENDTLEDVTLYMFLFSPNVETWEENFQDGASNTFFESVKFAKNINRNLVHSPPILGSPISQYGNAVYEIDGEEMTRMQISMEAGNAWRNQHLRAYLSFIVWDESVSQEMVRRIAQSYRREHPL